MKGTAITSRHRIQSIDVLRGIAMVVMALDHVRDLLFKLPGANIEALLSNPTNPAFTTPALFFTRWVTHFCAPIFVFLAGTSIYLQAQRKPRKELRAFLVKRGLWLVVVELLLINLAITGDPLYHIQILQVIWVIGVGMILLALCIGLPVRVITGIGLLIIAGHNLLDLPAFADGFKGHFWPDLLQYAHFTVHSYASDRAIVMVYALIPWTGVLFAGYGFGQIYRKGIEPVWRRIFLFRLGAALLALFVLLRIINIYGDPVPWAVQSRGSLYTFLSFLNVNKYPPSLIFLAMTLGVGMFALALLEPLNNRFTNAMDHFGRVPMFYYIGHFYLIRIIGIFLFFAQGYGTSQIVTPGSSSLFNPEGFGIGLGATWLVWILVVSLLYIPCRNYDRYKSSHKKWWLGYL